MTYGLSSGERASNRPFSYFVEGHPWDPNTKHGDSTGAAYPVPGTDEYYGLYSPLGDKYGDSSEYSGSWQHYCKYLQTYIGVSQFANGVFPGGTAYGGADPNRKWKFDKDTTEIHMYVDSPARPYFDTSDANMYSMEETYYDYQDQINQCVDFWKDYIDRGYVFQPMNYHNSYKINKEIVKGVLQYTGEWPESDPSS
jgi:hypothetical protein